LARTRPRAGSALDRRVARLLGVPVPVACRLIDGARARASARGFRVRVAAFLFATTRAGRLVLPIAARERAIHGLVGRMIMVPSENALYLGLDPLPEAVDCE
jgi:hypothetical protein